MKDGQSLYSTYRILLISFAFSTNSMCAFSKKHLVHLVLGISKIILNKCWHFKHLYLSHFYNGFLHQIKILIVKHLTAAVDILLEIKLLGVSVWNSRKSSLSFHQCFYHISIILIQSLLYHKILCCRS